MIVHSKIRDYKVELIDDLVYLTNVLKKEEAFYVIDSKVYSLYFEVFRNISEEKIFLLDALENVKTIDTVLQICDKLIEFKFKRNLTLIVCGGGITQDIAGFAANILYRGVRWVLIPTTLLAACDSCIGGKTSLNYKKYKNLLGTFYPPNEIFICPQFFETLSQTDYNSGLGEIIKFNIMNGKESLKGLQDFFEGAKSGQPIKKLVEDALALKKELIEADEFDLGQRVLLNFGHTFGHALEVSSQYEVPHGLAVALGILIANHISFCREMLTKENRDIMLSLVKKIINIPLKKAYFDFSKIIQAVKNDKKQINDQIVAILLDNDFRLKVFNDISESEIKNALEYIFYEFNVI